MYKELLENNNELIRIDLDFLCSFVYKKLPLDFDFHTPIIHIHISHTHVHTHTNTHTTYRKMVVTKKHGIVILFGANVEYKNVGAKL